MIEFIDNISLKPFNSFGLDVMAQQMFRYTRSSELIDFIKSGQLKGKPHLIVGGGSNLLFLSDFPGVVVHSGIDGIEVVEESGEEVIVAAGAGVEWDGLVDWSVAQGLGGIENLSHIPGSVGASPVQNIGAYGVELKDVFYKADGIYLHSGERFSLTPQQCTFDYRYSIFKGPLKHQTVITRVFLKLTRKPVFKLAYGSVREEVEAMGGPTLQNIRTVITQIRKAKLPDPEKLGNAGSFFKNPMVNRSLLCALKESYPDIPSYETNHPDEVKIPAGWLVEKAGWKGKSLGKAAVHHQQALVLVNLGGATGREILDLANAVESDVHRIFGINLEKEVNVVGA